MKPPSARCFLQSLFSMHRIRSPGWWRIIAAGWSALGFRALESSATGALLRFNVFRVSRKVAFCMLSPTRRTDLYAITHLLKPNEPSSAMQPCLPWGASNDGTISSKLRSKSATLQKLGVQPTAPPTGMKLGSHRFQAFVQGICKESVGRSTLEHVCQRTRSGSKFNYSLWFRVQPFFSVLASY